MKFKKKNRAPLAHSNLTEHENLRSHYDPNGSWTGTPDGWDKDVKETDKIKSADVESGREVYGEFMPTENGYVQSGDGERGSAIKHDVEAGEDAHVIKEYPLEGQAAPANGENYEGNTRDMQAHDYPDHMSGNGMAEVEAGGDMYTPCVGGKNGDKERADMQKLPPVDDSVYDDQAPMKLDSEAGEDLGDIGKKDVESSADIYQNDIEFDPDKYESGEWKNPPEECPAPKRDIETSDSFYPLGDVGTPASSDGYPSVPDGELTMQQAGVREDVVPVQDADDL